MNIEIKNLKIATSLSEETVAYTADIFVDGVRSFAASNHGHGAGDDFHAYPSAKVTEAEVNAWLAANVPPSGPWNDSNPRPAYDMGHTCDLETFMGRITAKAEADKETASIRRKYERQLANRLCGLDEQGHFLVFGKAIHKPTPANVADLRARLAAKGSATVLLNDADEATKARGLLAYCPGYGDRPADDTDEALRKGVFERLAADALTVADAKWLLAQPSDQHGGVQVDAAKLRDVVAKGEAAYAAYCAERDAARTQAA